MNEERTIMEVKPYNCDACGVEVTDHTLGDLPHKPDRSLRFACHDCFEAMTCDLEEDEDEDSDF
jgi:hypothetical protein